MLKRLSLFALAFAACHEPPSTKPAPPLEPPRTHDASAERPARVTVPRAADEDAELVDVRTGIAVRFRLSGASHVPAGPTVDGRTVYPRAIAESGSTGDLTHRVRPDGTEDFVTFSSKPSREELVYEVDVSRAAGVRHVARSFEVLDAHGAPALRVQPPWVVDAAGVRHAAVLDVEGCRYRENVSAPFTGRVEPPGANVCMLHVSWHGVTYPAVVDPGWVTSFTMLSPRLGHTVTALPSGHVLFVGGGNETAEIFDPQAAGGAGAFIAVGSMSTARTGHTASVLGSGRVVVVGGTDQNGIPLATAELIDPAAGVFVSTGAMSAPRNGHASASLADGRVLVTGGSASAPAGPGGSVEVFDESANGGFGAFAMLAPLLHARAFHTATALPSGDVLVAGGLGATSSIERYGASGGGASVALAELLVAPVQHSAHLLPSGHVILVGSSLGELVTEYDPTGFGFSWNWGESGVDCTWLAGSASALGPYGTLFVSGGAGEMWNCSAHFPSVPWQADTIAVGLPTKGWNPTSSALRAPRDHHSATALASGRILIAGGSGGDSAELYDAAPACASGFWADGHCCDRACGGDCESCVTGTCIVRAKGPACGGAYGAALCDGQSGACAGTCKTDQDCQSGRFCGQDGVCRSFVFSAQSCSGFARCGGYEYCDGGSICQNQKLNGRSCAADDECVSTSCQAGICACGPSSCAPGRYCTSTGVCVVDKELGVACKGAAECKSGFCSDGVCCDADCEGTACGRCNVDAGHCLAYTTVPRTPCPTSTSVDACAQSGCYGSSLECSLPPAGYVTAYDTCAQVSSKPDSFGTRTTTCDGKGTSHASTSGCTFDPACRGPTTCECLRDDDCPSWLVCNGKLCVPPRSPGGEGMASDDGGAVTPAGPSASAAGPDDAGQPTGEDGGSNAHDDAGSASHSRADAGCAFVPTQDRWTAWRTCFVAIAILWVARRRMTQARSRRSSIRCSARPSSWSRTVRR